MISKFETKTEWSDLSFVKLYIKKYLHEMKQQTSWMRRRFTLCQQVVLKALVTAVNKAAQRLWTAMIQFPWLPL